MVLVELFFFNRSICMEYLNFCSIPCFFNTLNGCTVWEARLSPNSLIATDQVQYDINMLCAEPTAFYNNYKTQLVQHPCIYIVPKSTLVLTSFANLEFVNTQLVLEVLSINRPLFTAYDECRRNQCSQTWRFKRQKRKQVKYDLCNVLETNN